jgi:ketosteroid isomerase-like protein
MDQKDRVIRELAAARRRGDFEEVRSLLADEIVWYEPGDADYSGDHRMADDVIALMKKLAATANLTLEPQEVLSTDEHAVARTRWWAERDGTRVEGNEIGVYRFDRDKIAEVWFWYDGYDQRAHDFVFSF